jgi:hypothetical protein
MAVAAVGCSSQSDGERFASVYVTPTHLPPGFDAVHFGCVQPDQSGRPALALGYRSDDRYTTAKRTETALLRVFVLEGERSREVLEHADSGSVVATKIHDARAWRYTVTTAEPVPTAWPAVAWQEGDVTIEVVGEGLDAPAVERVAESITSVSKADFEMLIPDQQC